MKPQRRVYSSMPPRKSILEPRTGIEYEDFALRLMPDGRGGHMVVVQHATGGGGSAPFEPSLSVDQLEPWMEKLEARLRGSDDSEMQPETVGAQLFRDLLRDRIQTSFFKSLAHQERNAATGLRLRLVFHLEDEGVAALAALPWELLHDPDQRRFLARDRNTPVVRCLDVHHSELPLAAEPPLNVLLIGAAPRDQPPPKLDEERQVIEQALEGHAELRIEIVPDGRLETLRELLAEHRPHILHFMGHGQFDRATGEGALIFQDARRRSHLVPGTMLAESLRNFRSVRLVVLTACESAAFPRRNGIDPYTGVATALVRDGVPAVVAMQLPIRAGAAKIFTKAFYRALARESAVDTAVAEGRLAIHCQREESLEWAVPALYMRSSHGRILPRVVDHDPPSESIRQEVLPFEAPERIHELTSGFVGRDFVFDRIEEFVRGAPRGYFSIEGEPGIGKSALVAELVRRRELVYHFNNRTAGICRHEAFLAHVCAQLILRYKLPHRSLPTEATRHAGFLQSLLKEARNRLPKDEPLVILVDALDEADRSGLSPGTNVLCLPKDLPGGVYMVLTGRPQDASHRPQFTCEQDRLTLDSQSENNRIDIQKYLEGHLGRPGLITYRRAQGFDEVELVERLGEKSEGNFMYLHHVLPELERGRYDDLKIRDLPSGLQAYYELHWQRMRGDDAREVWLDRKLPVLSALTRTSKPVAIGLLTQLSGFRDPRWVRSVLQEWRPFLDVSEVEDADGLLHKVYSIYHQSFHDFLTEKDEVSDVFWQEEREVIRGADQRILNAKRRFKP